MVHRITNVMTKDDAMGFVVWSSKIQGYNSTMDVSSVFIYLININNMKPRYLVYTYVYHQKDKKTGSFFETTFTDERGDENEGDLQWVYVYSMCYASFNDDEMCGQNVYCNELT